MRFWTKHEFELAFGQNDETETTKSHNFFRPLYLYNSSDKYLKMLQKILHKIGLNEKEIKIYLASLSFGSQPASVIAKNTKIARPTVYDIFKNLIKKGLASKTEKHGGTYFQVLPPENLIRYLEREHEKISRDFEQNKKEVEDLLPVLKSLQNPLSSKPKVKFFEGEKGVMEAYEDTLKSRENIRAYANVEEMYKGLPKFFPDYFKRRTEAGIFIHTICPDNEKSIERKSYDQVELREIRLIDKEKYEFSPEFNIYDNKVMIASWREKMAILIESEEIADFHKKMFDLLWSYLKK